MLLFSKNNIFIILQFLGLFAKLCTFEDDLKKDYLWFIDMHKDILDELPGVGKPEGKSSVYYRINYVARLALDKHVKLISSLSIS